MDDVKPYYETDNGVLYHGDCLEIMPELDSVDMVFTDPLYGHNNNNGDLISNWEKALGKPPPLDNSVRPLLNDDSVSANELFKKSLIEYNRLLKPGCCCCCCCGGGGGPDPQFARWSIWIDEILNFVQMVVWDKGPMGMGWRYRRSYETVLVSYKNGANMKWFDDSRKIENIIRPTSGIGKIIPSDDQHPTQKPVGLAALFIGLHTQQDDTVLDSFAGSGSTLVACERLGRRWIGIELDEKWCELTATNIENENRQLKLFG